MLCQIHPCPLSQGPLRSVKTRSPPLFSHSHELIYTDSSKFFHIKKWKRNIHSSPSNMLPQYTTTRVTHANGGREAKSGVIISVAAQSHTQACKHQSSFWLYPKREFGSLKRYWCWYWSGGGGGTSLIPDLEEAVPRASGHCHAIFCHTQATDAVVMARQNTCNKNMFFLPILPKYYNFI